jgi:hypothetical protein
MLASMGGHAACLAALATHGGSAALCKENSDGWTPAHFAAEYGHDACLAVLAKSDAATTFFFSARHNSSVTPPMAAAHATCLSVLAAKTARDVHKMEVKAWESRNPQPDYESDSDDPRSDGWAAWYRGRPQRSDNDATPATAAARASYLEKLTTQAAADTREFKAAALRKQEGTLMIHTDEFRDDFRDKVSMCVNPPPFATSDARVNTCAHSHSCNSLVRAQPATSAHTLCSSIVLLLFSAQRKIYIRLFAWGFLRHQVVFKDHSGARWVDTCTHCCVLQSRSMPQGAG